MKRKWIYILGVLLSAICMTAGMKSAIAKAAESELMLTKVDDISIWNDYSKTINSISINTTVNRDGNHIYKFTLDADGYVSLLITSRKVDKITEKVGASYAYSTTDASVTATIYRDSGLLFPVAPVLTAKGESPVTLTQKVALDKGTYYIAVKADKYNSSASNNTTTITYALGTAELIVYYQPLESNETNRPSMPGKENQLAMDITVKGVLTVTNPKDYYIFTLRDRALVKIRFLYSSPNQAKFTLYGTTREELLSKTFNGNNTWIGIEKYLEPGTYYCSLESTKQYDGGTTAFLLIPTYYPLMLDQINSTSNTYITITTIDAPKEVRYLPGNQTDLTSVKWNTAALITDTLRFGINNKGFYTVRVIDQYNNMFLQSIQVKTCDMTAPALPVIKTCTAGTYVVSGMAEKNSLVTVYVNGKPNTCTATAKGTYKCILPSALVKGSLIEVTAQDVSGNISEKAEIMLE